VSLTNGRGPLGPDPAGRFEPRLVLPGGALYVEPHLRRVRALQGERTVIDSERVVLVHRPGRPPAYAFPEGDVQRDVPTSPEPAVPGYVRVPWDAMTAWYEEEEQVVGNPRNPYHRIDCIRVRRRLRVEVAGTVLVDTTDTLALYETSRAPQLYVKRDAVRTESIVPSATRTYCPYKGTASYWSAKIGDALVEDVAWSYEEPTPESRPVAGLLSFYADRTNMLQDVPRWFEVPTRPAGAPETA
jgi:uncharacterized protein (DUF427 family)